MMMHNIQVIFIASDLIIHTCNNTRNMWHWERRYLLFARFREWYDIQL